MALTATTLNGAVAATDTRIVLTSGTGAAVGSFIKIDGEVVRILDITDTPTIWVQRGQQGTLGVAHTTLAPATIGLAADFPVQPAPRIYSYGADGALTVAPGNHYLTKATTGAYTIADPTAAQDGLTMVITNATTGTHVITGTTIWDGTSTVNTLLTFTALIGSSCTLEAVKAKWNTISLNAVTPS